jgi:hypothetical protein
VKLLSRELDVKQLFALKSFSSGSKSGIDLTPESDRALKATQYCNRI